jgi:hypothetical protein
MNFFRQLVYGLDYLHAHAICHRDLKPENILLTEMNEIKIADFGFARWMKENIAQTSCGSPHYAAPEVVRGTPYDGRTADIWSSGVILYALLAGRLPFYDPIVRNVLTKVKSGHFVMPDSFLPEIQNLISAMLTVDASARITLENIKQHPAFRIGLADPSYVLPVPLQMPVPVEPIEMDSVAPPVLAVLHQIGFTSDDELRAELATTGHSMAKVFFHMLTSKNPPEDLPWETAAQPSEMQNEMTEDDDDWADLFQKDFSGELIQPCLDIPIKLEVLLARMQKMVSELGFQWFHPNDYTILAKSPSEGVGLTVTARPQSEGLVSMDLHFTNANQEIITRAFTRLRALLAPE